MEQQTVSVAKAGLISTLNARTSVLACANPKGSKYDDGLSLTDNINLPPSLLSRFDLIYLVRDVQVRGRGGGRGSRGGGRGSRGGGWRWLGPGWAGWLGRGASSGGVKADAACVGCTVHGQLAGCCHRRSRRGAPGRHQGHQGRRPRPRPRPLTRPRPPSRPTCRAGRRARRAAGDPPGDHVLQRRGQARNAQPAGAPRGRCTADLPARGTAARPAARRPPCHSTPPSAHDTAPT
jgi:hypothetical protein